MATKFSISLPDTLGAKLRKKAKARKDTMSRLVREALEALFGKER